MGPNKDFRLFWAIFVKIIILCNPENFIEKSQQLTVLFLFFLLILPIFWVGKILYSIFEIVLIPIFVPYFISTISHFNKYYKYMPIVSQEPFIVIDSFICAYDVKPNFWDYTNF